MPSLAIPFIASAIAATGISVAVSTFIATVFVYAASAVLLNAAAKALAPKRRSAAGLAGSQEVNYFDTGAGIRIAYGTTQTGGMETIPPVTSGVNNRFLHKLITIAGHETEGLHCQFDTTSIQISSLNPNTGANSDIDGQVVLGTYSGHAWVRYYTGNSLAPTYDHRFNNLTSNGYAQNLQARATGITTAAITLLFNSEIYKSVPVFSFRYNGKKIYDPRLDVTPGASPFNTTYAPTANPNPALALADYLMSPFGGGYDSDEIDWTTVVSAANYCEGSVAIPTAATRRRYTCNGVVIATTPFIENVKLLVDSMLGRIIFADGKWRIYAGSWKTPSFTITQNDWISGLSIKFEQGLGKRFNKGHCWYIDKDRNYQRVECLPQSDSGYLAVDGSSEEAETEQLLCDNEYEAQAKARLLLRQSRNQIIISGTLPPRFQDIAIWDTGTIVYEMFGWSSKTFRATNLSMRPDGAIDCVFSEEQEDDWDDLLEADYNTQSITPLPSPNATFASEPSSFTATEQINGTILFSMGTPIIKPPGSRFQILRGVNSDNAGTATIVYEGDSAIVPLVMPTSRHWYWSRCITNSQVSAYQPNTFGIFARAMPQAEGRFAQDLISDPEFSFSAENGHFWQNSLTAAYSLSLTGGVGANGGVMYFTCQASASNFDMIYSLPNSPFIRNTNPGRPVNIQMRLRPLFTATSGSVRRARLFAIPWNGQFPVSSSNTRIGASAVLEIEISSFGAMPSSGQWVSRTCSAYVLDTNVSSYPYLVCGFRPSMADSASPVTGVTGELWEYDCIYAKLL